MKANRKMKVISEIYLKKDNILSSDEYNEIIKTFSKTQLKDLKNYFFIPKLDNDSLDEDKTLVKVLYEEGKEELFFNNYVGYIKLKNTDLQIKSKVDNSDEQVFISHMLSKVFGVSAIKQSISAKKNSNAFSNSILKQLFFIYFNKAMKKGLYQKYCDFQYNNLNVKGKIEIEKHIKINTPFTGKIAYSTRELTPINDINFLIYHTLESLKNESFELDRTTRNNIRKFKNLMGKNNSKLRNILNKNKKCKSNHKYYKEYTELQKISMILLEKKGFKFNESSNLKLNGFLIDAAWLFEQYINTLIKDKFYHLDNRDESIAEYYFTNNYQEIYPDFISKEANKIILDVKYKKFEYKTYPIDFHQILGYMNRFNTNTGYLVKLSNKNKDKNIFNLKEGFEKWDTNKKRESNVEVIEYNFYVPDTETEEFKKLIKDSENKLKKEFDI